MLHNKETMAVSNQLAPICDPKAIAVLIFFRVQQFVVRTIIHGGRFCLANSVKSTFGILECGIARRSVQIETLRPCLVSCFGCLSKVSQPSREFGAMPRLKISVQKKKTCSYMLHMLECFLASRATRPSSTKLKRIPRHPKKS